MSSRDELITELIEAALNEVQQYAQDPDSPKYKQARERYEKAVLAATPLVAEFHLPDHS